MRVFDTNYFPATISGMEPNKLAPEEIVRIRKRLGAEIRGEREKRRRRDRKDWTQQKLAERVGYKKGASIGAIERGKVFPQGGKLVRIMMVLGLHMDDIVFPAYEKKRRPLRMIFEDLPAPVIQEMWEKGKVEVPLEVGEAMLQKASVHIRREPSEGNGTPSRTIS